MKLILLFLLPALAALASIDCSVPRQPAALALDTTTTVYTTTTALLRGRVIPDSVFAMTRLRSLTIAGMDCDVHEMDSHGNDITQCWTIDSIPPEIGRLEMLEELRLPLNAISALPMELGRLRKLRVLDLTENSLTDIEAAALPDGLEDLGLCDCGLQALPKDLSRLGRLRHLCLVGNHLDPAERQRIRRALPRCEIVF